MNQPPRRWLDDPQPSDPEVAKARLLLERAGEAAPGAHAKHRVWRRLEAPGEPRSRRLIAVAATAAAAVLAIVVASRSDDRNQAFAKVTSVEGLVHIAAAGEDAQSATAGQDVAQGARIRTAPGGSSVVAVRAVDQLQISGDSDVLVAGDDGDTVIAIERGEVVASVQPRPNRPPFVVTAGQWRVRVVGTIFRVSRRELDQIEVEVERGIVEVTGPNRQVRLTAGERFTSSDGRVSAARQAPEPTAGQGSTSEPQTSAGRGSAARRTPEASAARAKTAGDGALSGTPPRRRRATNVEAEALARRPAVQGTNAIIERPSPATRLAPSGGESGSAPAPGETPRVVDTTRSGGAVAGRSAAAGATPRSGPTPPEGTSGSALPTPPTDNQAPPPAVATVGADGVTPSIPVAPRSREAADASRGATPSVRDPARTDRAPPKQPSAGQAYRSAVAERDPAKAIAMLDRVGAGSSSWAEVAAHRAALASMQLGRFGDATDRLERLRKRFPNGSYDQEARLSLIECRVQLGKLPRASADLAAFLARYPASERSGELRFLRAEIARKDGRCADAIADYQAVGSSRRAEDALYFEAWCAMQTGDDTTATSILERYVARYPKGRHAERANAALRAK